MGSFVRLFRGARLLAASVFLACGADQTKPGGGTETALAVTAVQPATILATNLPQLVTIVGSGFVAPTVALTSPAGDTTQFSGTQLVGVSATSISAQMTVGTAGGWRVIVRNGNGTSSPPFSFTVGPAAAPTVQSVSPATIVTGAAPQRVTISGTGFQRGSTVLFTRGEITDFAAGPGGPDSLSATSLSFSLSTSAGHLDYDLFVVNSDGQMSASSVHLSGRQATPDPTVTSLTPATIGISSAKQIIAFTGTGFENGIDVLLTDPNGTIASFTGASLQTPTPATLRIFVLLNVSGTWKYRLVNQDGSEADGTFNVGPPLPNQTLPPAITGVTPGNLVAGDAEQTITVQGTSFQSGLTASFVSHAVPFTDSGAVVSVTPTAVQIKVLLGQGGSWSVSLQNPDGAPSNTFNFTVAAAPASPPTPITIVSAQPSPVMVSLNSQAVLLNGTGFALTSTVRVTRPPADLDVETFENFFPDHLSRTQIRLNGVFDRAGVWHVEVDSASAQSNVFDILVKTPTSPAPAVTSLDPQPLATLLAQIFRVRGSNFQQGLRMLVVGDDSTRWFSPSNFTVDSVTPTSARFVGSLPRSGRLQIQNADGQVSNIVRYIESPLPLQCTPSGPYYRSDSPQSISMSCQSGQAGLTVVLTDPSGAVRPISGLTVNTAFTGFVFVSFNATIDTGGSWKIAAANPDGQQTSTSMFTYTFPAPTITGVPSSALTASHTPQSITIQGTGFQTGLAVKLVPQAVNAFLQPVALSGSQIGNIAATSLQISPTLWLAGKWAVAVTNPDGQSVTSPPFNVSGLADPPSLSSVSPSTLAVSTPRLLTISGQNFEQPFDVIVTSPSGVNSNPSIAALVNRTTTQFQLYIGFDQPGTWKIAVRNRDNQSSNSVSFTVQ